MEYNTIRKHLIIPEYGRNIQKMVEFALTIEDRDERNQFAKMIVQVMANMNTQLKDTNDFEQKLWDHLYIISDFKLDVDGPFPKPNRKDVYSKPEKVPYSEDHIKFKHYGLNLEKMIKTAIDMEDGDEKTQLVKWIANYMKRSYLTWNRDSVTDVVIYTQLNELAGGKLTLNVEDPLISASEVLPSGRNAKKKKNKGSQRKVYNKKYR